MHSRTLLSYRILVAARAADGKQQPALEALRMAHCNPASKFAV